MKKVVAVIAVFVAIIAISIMSAACSNDSITGTYKFSKVSFTYNGQINLFEVGQEFNGMTLTEDSYVLTVKKDGTFTVTSLLPGEEEAQNGTWKSENGQYIFTVEGQVYEVTLSGAQLTLSTTQSMAYGDMTESITFKKSSSSSAEEPETDKEQVGNTASAIAGNYKFVSITITGAVEGDAEPVQEIRVGDSLGGGYVVPENLYVLTVKEDGTLSMELNAESVSQTYFGSWTVKGEQYLMTMEGDNKGEHFTASGEMKLSGTQLTLSIWDGSQPNIEFLEIFVFEKA